MARNPTSPFGAWPPKPKKQKNPFAPVKSDTPAMRKPAFEQLLCQAIRSRTFVELRYEDDITERMFAPDVVYPTSKLKVCVSGRQMGTLELEPHTFEVGKIKSLSLTERTFTPDPRFNLADPRYRNRICPL